MFLYKATPRAPRPQRGDGLAMRGLFRARHHRPRYGSAADEADEIPPLHATPKDQIVAV